MADGKSGRRTPAVLLTAFLLTALVSLAGLLIYLRAEHADDALQAPPAPSAISEAPASSPSPAPEALPTPAPTAGPEPPPLAPVELTDFRIERELFQFCERQGSSFITEYETRDYASGSDAPVTKKLAVYLPFGYSEEERYDVLFLLHVQAASERFWLMDGFYYDFGEGDEAVDLHGLLDNMIAAGRCRPLIVIMPSGYITPDAAYEHNSARDYPQFAAEFANDLLPFVAENFATYAEGSDRESLIAAREHFGVLGASFGAYMAKNSILLENYEFCSWYGFTGGGGIDSGAFLSARSAAGEEASGISMLFTGEGEWDDRAEAESSYYTLREYSDIFNDTNLVYSVYRMTGHDCTEWVNSLYNCLQLFFRQSE